MNSVNAPDIFISYAHVDNDSQDKAIDCFVQELESKVNQQVGRASAHRIWKDNRLDGHHSFSAKIQQKLKQSNCLLVFLSRGYLASEWCLKELHTFYKENQQHPERIFFIELDVVAIDEKPEVLQQALGYRFWMQDSLSKDTYPLEPDDKTYKNTLLKLAKDMAKQIQHSEAFKDTLQQAKQASRNEAHGEAIKLWQAVKEIQPDHTMANEEIASLQEKQQQHNQIDQWINQLFSRMQEIPSIFTDVVPVLQQIDNHPKAQAIIKETQQFLDNTLSAEDYIKHCQQELSSNTTVKTNTAVDYQKLAKRITNGNTVLFLGSELPKEYGEHIADEQQLAGQLAETAGYPKFTGTFSAIAEYYQLRPEYGRNELLDKLDKTLFNNPSVLNFYNLLARIEQPLVLIASSYDCTLESILQQHNKPYAVLSSIINRGDKHKVGHIVVKYSDNKKCEEACTEEDLSQLKLLEQGYSLIYKIKGSCENGTNTSTLQKDALLLSESNFFTFARNADKVIPSYLVKHFQDRSFMFLGFNPKSWEDRLLVNALLEKRRYISTPCYTAGTSEDPLEAAYWDNQNVQQYDINIQQLDAKIEEALA